MAPIRPRCVVCGILGLLLVSSTTVRAEEDDAARSAARVAAYEGVRDFERGDFSLAVDKLGSAFSVAKVPTVGLWYARALVKVGKLVEASERYGEVLLLEPNGGKISEQKKAQADAADELEALKPRIPNVRLSIRGASESCEVSIDGKVVPNRLMGFPVPVNPGPHRIQAVQGDHIVEQNVTFAEGESKIVELAIDATQAPAAEAAPSAVAGSSGSAAAHATGTPTGKTQKTLGWVALGLGGVATVAGVTTGILVLSKRSQLKDTGRCQDTRCLRSEHDEVASYNQMRTLSTVGFIVGAVGLGAGTALLLTTPKSKDTHVSAWIGVGRVGVEGSF